LTCALIILALYRFNAGVQTKKIFIHSHKKLYEQGTHAWEPWGVRVSNIGERWRTKALSQGVTRRCRLSWLSYSPRISSPNAGGGWGDCGVSANEYSCAHHVTWSPNKLWRSNSIFNLSKCMPLLRCATGCWPPTPFLYSSEGR
jgi:hypothetical protein